MDLIALRAKIERYRRLMQGTDDQKARDAAEFLISELEDQAKHQEEEQKEERTKGQQQSSGE